MGRNLSPVLQRELANLDKDADSRKSAMKALKLYVKDLDTKAIPLFLAQVSGTKGPGSSSGECTISLYEVLARVHGPNIVPQIDNIMSTIIKTMASSSGSFPLQQACSKVVPAIARYGIDPMTPEDKKMKIIHSLCKPLSDSLLGSQEGLASGAALCLKALVDADNWRFASDEIVNEVCLRVAGGLEEKPTQTNSHMGLAMALAKHNSLIFEAYARSLIRSGLRILDAGVADGNSQKRLSAIQMVNFLMKCVDPRSIFTELGTVIEEMEKCLSDQMAFVRGAAFEALQTAKIIVADKSLRFEKDSGSITGANFGRRRDHSRRINLWNSRDRSPVSASPESHTVDSFVDYDSLVESPVSIGQVSCNLDYGDRCVNRRLWKNENGGVDLSLKDNLFSEVSRGGNSSHSFVEGFKDGEISNNGEQSGEFSGFLQESPSNGATSSTTPSPQRPLSQLNIDDIKIFTTPRKLICSLQDPNDGNSDFSEKRTMRFRNRNMASNRSQWSPRRKLEGHAISYDLKFDAEGTKNVSKTGEWMQINSESVSSTDDVLTNAPQEVYDEVNAEDKTGAKSTKKRRFMMAALNLICCLFILLAITISVMWTGTLEEGSYLVPT
ncbi:protein SINE1-like [Macadamia integrifolia]|uniref:protein SINE1-like n=1 Tax=Macadamia integrifolia TaxID=60698 RepID=UPI001C530AFC|nr:protein SINE1-like [Macadamia integrifolia]